MTEIRQELEQLLSEKPGAARAREAETLAGMAGALESRLVFMGAGYLGRTAAQKLQEQEITPLAFADADPAKAGTNLDGIPILSLEEAASRYGNDAAFVVAIWQEHHQYVHSRDLLKRLGVARVIPYPALVWRFPDLGLPFFDAPHQLLEHKEEVYRLFDLLADDLSRRHLIDQIRCRLRLDFEQLAPCVEPQYFPAPVLPLREDEAFVDCGAFDGDTAIHFLEMSGGRFQRLFSLEPDPESFQRLQARLAACPASLQARITPLQAAVGAQREQAWFYPAGAPSSALGQAGPGAVELETRALDELLKGESPTFLKFDVEGAEAAALKGAARIIREEAPVLAVCVYHKPDDLWSLPLQLHGLNPDYRLYLRRHGGDGVEMVIYAIPPDRLSTGERAA